MGRQGKIMRIGIGYPIFVFIVAVAFLSWFAADGYAMPSS
ncbi:YoaK family small membrane protein [Citrobacter portucalensis]